jgi:hypothetical protein
MSTEAVQRLWDLGSDGLPDPFLAVPLDAIQEQLALVNEVSTRAEPASEVV